MLVEHLATRSPLTRFRCGVLYAHQQEDYTKVNTIANDKQDVGFCSSWCCFVATQTGADAQFLLQVGSSWEF